MRFLFLPFLTAAFSVSNAALDSDNSDPLLASSLLPNPSLPGSLSNPNLGNENLPLLASLSNLNSGNNDLPHPASLSNLNSGNNDLPLPASSSNPDLGNEYLPLPDLLSLNPPAPGNEPVPINLNLDPIHSETPEDKSTFSQIAQEASINGAEDGGESSTVNPPMIQAQTQPHTDGFYGMCISDSSTGQNRRKRQAMCKNPAMLEFRREVPKQHKAGRTIKEKENDNRKDRDIEWMQEQFKERFGRKWKQVQESQVTDYIEEMAQSREDACVAQSEAARGINRPYAMCCIGPSQDVIMAARLRLARRRTRVITNWFNCDIAMVGRPFCDPGIFDLCCAGYWDEADSILNEPAALWEWGVKAYDCVEALAV